MHHRYHDVRFLTSVDTLVQLPSDAGREVAFAGRSNAGKSSALNAIVGRRALARVSKTPGRTRMINFFAVDEDRHLVDLPGYGYARVPEAVKRHWQATLGRYLAERRALQGLVLLMDIRHPLTVLDRQMLAWCTHRPLPTHVLLTKCDKLGRGAAAAALQALRRELAREHPGASAQLFSATQGTGVDTARAQLDAWLGLE